MSNNTVSLFFILLQYDIAVLNTEIPLTFAVRMLTETPAKIMRLTNKGAIACGMDADLVIFDDVIQVNNVIARGKRVL